MAGVLDAVKAMQVAENQQRAREQKQAEYNSLRNAGLALGAAGVAAPPGIASTALVGMNLMNDYRMAQMEEDDPSLAKGLGPQRYSTVGQMLGFGYPNQTGIPKTGIFDRLRNAITGDDGLPDPRTNIWNARGTKMTIVQPGSTGFETSGGGSDSPSPSGNNTYNFGGRESAVSYDDYSRYA